MELHKPCRTEISNAQMKVLHLMNGSHPIWMPGENLRSLRLKNPERSPRERTKIAFVSPDAQSRLLLQVGGRRGFAYHQLLLLPRALSLGRRGLVDLAGRQPAGRGFGRLDPAAPHKQNQMRINVILVITASY